MAIIDLADMKAHLGVLDDVDNALITGKIEAAQAHLESLLGYAIEDEFDTVPADLKDAVRQLAAGWFENREATGATSIMETPMSVWSIVTERRSYAFE